MLFAVKDPAKKRLSEVLIAYTDEFTGTVFTSFKSDPIEEAGENRKFDALLTSVTETLLTDSPYILCTSSCLQLPGKCSSQV